MVSEVIQCLLGAGILGFMWRIQRKIAKSKPSHSEHCQMQEKLLSELGVRLNVNEVEVASLRRRVAALERKFPLKGTSNA